jgi:hypothetical protein
MEHLKILTRAWDLTWRNRALWLFGFLFVLTGGAGGGSGSNNAQWSGNGGDWENAPWGHIAPPNFDTPAILIIIAIALIVILFLSILAAIVRYVAETAMIAGADEIERQVETPFTVRRGFQLGRTQAAWHMFLADLIIHLPIIAITGLLLILGIGIAAVTIGNKGGQAPFIGVASVLLLLCPTILIIIIVALVISLIRPYIQRQVVLGQHTPMDAIRRGIRLVRTALLDTGLLWLLLAGLSIAWAVVMIPVVLVLLVVAGVVGLLPAGVIYLTSQNPLIAGLVGLPLFLLVFVPLFCLIQGIFEVYKANVWTLAYREVTAKKTDVLPAPITA